MNCCACSLISALLVYCCYSFAFFTAELNAQSPVSCLETTLYTQIAQHSVLALLCPHILLSQEHLSSLNVYATTALLTTYTSVYTCMWCSSQPLAWLRTTHVRCFYAHIRATTYTCPWIVCQRAIIRLFSTFTLKRSFSRHLDEICDSCSSLKSDYSLVSDPIWHIVRNWGSLQCKPRLLMFWP